MSILSTFPFKKAFTRNRLSSYRSYRYYFALAICDSSVTAEKLSERTNLDTWKHEIDVNKQTKYGIKTIRLTENVNLQNTQNPGIGKYILLIDGSSDADFVITDVKYSSLTAANAVPGDFGSSVAVEGNIKISEPRGVIFLDTITRANAALGIDPAQAVYVLKVFFVGYRDDGTFQNEPISDIRPIMFIPYDVSGIFTAEGGVYEVQFAAISNGVSRMPQYSQFDGISVNCRGNIVQAMSDLETQLNLQYTNIYNSIKSKFEEIQREENFQGSVLYEPIEYRIIVDPYYHINASKYVPSDGLQQYKDGGCDCSCIIKNPIGGSVEGMIRMLMETIPQVKNDKIDKQQIGVKYEYKIMTTVRRVLSATPKTQIIYVVKRFVTPQTGMLEFISKNQNSSNFDPSVIERNVVEFDYIYTGKNVDVLNFDIKVNIGLAYLQIATSGNAFRQPTEGIQPKRFQMVDVVKAESRTGNETPLRVVVFPGIRPTNLVNNTNVPNASIGSMYTMAKHASLESSTAKVRIVGNTSFLEAGNKLSTSSSAFNFLIGNVEYKIKSDPITGEVFRVNALSDFDQRQKPTVVRDTNVPDYGDFPCYAKINIKMPQGADDLDAFRFGTDYSKNFWWDGLYYVFAIDHEFSSGEFTQTLDMITVPDPKIFEDNLQKNKRRTEIVNKSTVQQQDNKIDPCTQFLENRQSIVPFKTATDNQQRGPTSGSATETLQDSTKQLEKMRNDLTMVKGWSEAPEAARNGILGNRRVSTGTVDPALLAQLSYRLTNYNPSFINPFRGTAGMYAWPENRWLSFVRSRPTIVSGINPQQILQQRLDPNKSSQVTSQYIESLASSRSPIVLPGDVLMTFVLNQIKNDISGEILARTFIAEDRRGRGDTLLERPDGFNIQVLYEVYPSARNYNNGQGVKTSRDIRIFFANEMAWSLKQGVPVATDARQGSGPQSIETPGTTGNNQNQTTSQSAQTACGPSAGANPAGQDKTAQDSLNDTKPCEVNDKYVAVCGEVPVNAPSTGNVDTQTTAQPSSVQTNRRGFNPTGQVINTIGVRG